MRKEPNLKLIGIFVIFGMIVFAGIMAIFLKDKMMVRKKDQLVMYFDGSIKGLSVGSPLYIRGVQIGKVVEIDMITDIEDLSFRVPVFVEIHPSKNVSLYRNTNISREEIMEHLVNNGMRARLITQSLITGQLGIELVMDKKTMMYFRGTHSSNKGVVEIPTMPSVISQLAEELQGIHIKDSVNELNNLLKSVNKYAPNILAEAEKMAKTINHNLNLLDVETNNPIDNLNKTLKNFSEMAQSLKNFADYIERNPEALIRGKGRY